MPSTPDPIAKRPGLVAAIVPRIRALAESPEMLAIQRALPLSFIGLAIGLAGFMLTAKGTFLERFSLSFAAAFGVMSALLVVVLAYVLALRRNVLPWLAVATCGTAFVLSLPYRDATSFEALARALGSSGLFLAIGIALLGVDALAFAQRRFGMVAGSVAGSALVVAIAAVLLATGISLTAALDVAIAPLGNLGDSLTALLIITLVETLLWTIGIHGPALLAAVVLPVYINLQLQNTAALSHHLPLPHIVTVSMFLFVFPGGAGATLPLVLLLLRSRVKRVRTVALATLLPSLANANEPLMFGLPLVLNPVLGVPFVVTPLVLAIVAWYAMSLGLVSRPAYYIPSTIPLPIGAFLATRDWRSVILMLLNVAIGAAIYAPFVAIYERQELGRAHVPETAA
ncbi:MAG: PTS sugar transporter subunit IIC [Candidatus Eremiobacteraeota bacterium]|nr:PTS sugar transporter subunit IIC [Candidatus Eremiobacteraeota bacterium]